MLRLDNLSVKVKLGILIGVFAAGFAAFVLMTAEAMSPKLAESDFADVIVMKDVVADVLPPPAYIIESYLVLLQMAHESDPRAVAKLQEKWSALRASYEERRAVWLRTLPEGPLKQSLTQGAVEPAHEFFELAEHQYFPAVAAHDQVAMGALLVGPLKAHYDRHRVAIDDVVTRATQQYDDSTRVAEDKISARLRQLALVGAGILAVGLGIAWAIGRSITVRIRETVQTLSAVGGGDFTGKIDGTAKDELGQMAGAVNRAVGTIRAALVEVRGVSSELTGSAQQLSASAEDIAAGAQEQAASLEETAASLEQITATVKQSSDNAQQASRLALLSREVAEKGGEVVGNAVAAMGGINESSRRIADIITTIDEIAFQTNLLALNAAVEAARAGEQGRGFAVVAAEVRNLAQRSGAAAREIKGLIQDSVRRVEAGTELVNRSGQSLSEIVGSVKRVTDLVAEMASAFREQSIGIEQVNKAVTQMDTVTQASSTQTEELSGMASALAGQATRIQSLVARFRLGEETQVVPPPARPRWRKAIAVSAMDRAMAESARNGSNGKHVAHEDSFEDV